MRVMVKFSSDVDILKYEPILFGQLHLSGQIVSQGTGGSISGVTFTASGADFVSAGVAAGSVIHLRSSDGVLDGGYEIISVDSATQLSVSVVRADSEDSAVAPPAGSSITYRICVYDPQANEAGFQLTEYFGIGPGNPASEIDADDILDTNVLRRASVFLVISSVYAMLASRNKDENLWEKSHYYRKSFEKARQRCRLSIDTGSDGVGDIGMVGGSVRMVRD